MRISDWSSDVCSSDLCFGYPETEAAPARSHASGINSSHLELKFATIQSRHPELVSGSIVPQAMTPNGEEWMLKQVQHDGHDNKNFSQERKSVVKGKSVTVRVDLVGRVILNNKKKKSHAR